MVADTDSESGAEASDIEDYFEEGGGRGRREKGGGRREEGEGRREGRRRKECSIQGLVAAH